jgi:hypothetical protein
MVKAPHGEDVRQSFRNYSVAHGPHVPVDVLRERHRFIEEPDTVKNLAPKYPRTDVARPRFGHLRIVTGFLTGIEALEVLGVRGTHLELRPHRKLRDLKRELFRKEEVVGIEERNEVSGGFSYPPVSRGGHTTVLLAHAAHG